MKSYLQGKVITNNYEVDYELDGDGLFKNKPELKVTTTTKYETLKRKNGEDFVIDGEIGLNNSYNIFLMSFGILNSINLSEDEQVGVVEKVYRADLNAYMVHLDKIISEKDNSKEETESYLKECLRKYNEQMITRNAKLKAYCDVHKLDPAETDYEELKKIVYDEVKTEYTKRNDVVDTATIGLAVDDTIYKHWDKLCGKNSWI